MRQLKAALIILLVHTHCVLAKRARVRETTGSAKGWSVVYFADYSVYLKDLWVLRWKCNPSAGVGLDFMKEQRTL